MKLQERIEVLDQLGNWLTQTSEELEQIKHKAELKNPWFSRKFIDDALESIAVQFLQKNKLAQWAQQYPIDETSPKKVALILAGNIPAVGFHDILSVFMSNHTAQIKLSTKDDVLIPALIRKMQSINPDTIPYFEFVTRIEQFDAAIATGSNNTSIYFQQYFSKYPHIIRKSKHAIGIVYPDISDQEIIDIGQDIYQYYGLGCRNISKLYIHNDVKLERLMELWHNNFDFVLQHTKYMNNFDYNYALYLMNEDDFLINGGLILKKDNNLHSRIASVHYERFENNDDLVPKVENVMEDIQCIISTKTIQEFPSILPGESQYPRLEDYADGVDIMHFLNNEL